MAEPVPPRVAGGILPVSSHRFLRSPFFGFYDCPAARFGVYNQRLYPLDLGGDVVADYWSLRREVLLFDVPERPLEIRGPDAVRLLESVLTRRVGTIGVQRAAYALACNARGGVLMDGVLLRLAEDRFWYVIADGEFLPWLEAHALGLDVQVFDPLVWVLQVQGPRSLELLRATADPPPPPDWKYFGVATTRIAGQDMVVSRTGWTGELGFEIYTPIAGPHNEAMWQCLLEQGAHFGLRFGALASMTIRRIEAGILDYGTDFDRSMNPWQAGLGRFVAPDAVRCIGHAALLDCDRRVRLAGLRCEAGTPGRGTSVREDGRALGHITASAYSPFLRCGIAYARFDDAAPPPGSVVQTETDAGVRGAQLVQLPFHDPDKRIARGL